MPALRQYVLVSQEARKVEVWTRDDTGGWVRTVARDGDVALLGSIGSRLDVDELYASAAGPHAE